MLSKIASMFATAALVMLGSLATAGAANATDIGEAWSNATAPAGVAGLDAVAFGDGVFVGVNAAGYIVRSTDGKAWTLVEQTSTAWNSVAFGGGSFVILGLDGSGPVFRASTDDGVTFGAAASTASLTSTVYAALSYGQGTFIALDAGDGTCAVAISTDAGQSWSDGARSDSCDDYASSAFGNNLFVSVSTAPSIEYTDDPSSQRWNAVSFGPNVFPLSGDVPSQVTFNGAEFMFMLTDSNGDVYSYTSADGQNWPDGVLTSGLPSSEYRGLGWDGSAWLLGAGGTGTGIYRSLDGVNWTEVDSNNTEWNAFATGNGIVVAGGDPTSPTGQGLDSTIAIGWSAASVAPTPDVPSADTLAKTGVNGSSELAVAGAAAALVLTAGLLLRRSRRHQND